MAVYHVLKDGSKVDSVKDYVIKMDQFPQVYRVIERIEERGETDETIRTPEESFKSN